MAVTTTPASRLVLTDELLHGIEQRADGRDRDGRPSRADFEALREIGYYHAPVPAAYGGPGLTLPEVAALQRRIGYRSAPAALAAGPHLSWAGAAAERVRAGDTDAERLLRAVADGEIIGAGHGQRGKDTSANGPKGADAAFLDSVAAWSVVLTANVHLGVAQRAFDLAVEVGASHTSPRLDGRPRTEDPVLRAGLAESVADLDAVEAHLDAAAHEWAERPVADAAWSRRLLSVRQHTTRTARTVAARGLDSVGGRSPRLGPVIERLYRDVAAETPHSPAQDTISATLGSPALTSRESFNR